MALVLRGDAELRRGFDLTSSRLAPFVEAFAKRGLVAEAVVFSEPFADEVRTQLLDTDAVLVWADPVSGDADREVLDTVLRDVSDAGVYVSAHPDTIVRMGTKQVLYDTRALGWGSDVHLYRDVSAFYERFPARLESAGPRVLKQYRGNGGIGVVKVELAGRDAALDCPVRVQHARVRDARVEEMSLRQLMRECEKYFSYAQGDGRLIDQPFQARISDGMIRSYLVKNRVVGFARQYPPNLPDEPSGPQPANVFGLASDKTMYPANEPTFATLRTHLEDDWIPALQTTVGVSDAALPILWDADFLFGPVDTVGKDTYVLCEINVSAVAPFPPQAVPLVAAATADAIEIQHRTRDQSAT